MEKDFTTSKPLLQVNVTEKGQLVYSLNPKITELERRGLTDFLRTFVVSDLDEENDLFNLEDYFDEDGRWKK